MFGRSKPKRDGAQALAQKKWYHFWSKKNMEFDENADPKVQMRQVMQAAMEEDRRLRDAAATVIGNERTAEMQLNRLIQELEKLDRNTKAALKLEAQEKDPAKKAQYSASAKQLFGELKRKQVAVEKQKQLVLQAAAAADQAQAAVEQNARTLQEAMSNQQHLLAQNDQAEMQESMNAAMATLTSAIGDGITPTFSEVQKKIEDRMGKALGASQINAVSPGNTMAAIEAASMDIEADAGLDAMRAELGLLPQPAELPAGDAAPQDDASADELAPRRAQSGS